jgi:serine/threonine protein kinase
VEVARRGVPNIVEILRVNADGNPPSILMAEYQGNSNALLGRTRGNVVESARLLLPIAKTLFDLACHQDPIYHRDLKPDNLLYRETDPGVRLVVADFGCAYFRAGEDSRLINSKSRSA